MPHLPMRVPKRKEIIVCKVYMFCDLINRPISVSKFDDTNEQNHDGATVHRLLTLLLFITHPPIAPFALLAWLVTGQVGSSHLHPKMASARIIAPELGLPGVLTKPPQHTLTKGSSRRGKSSSSSRHGHRHRSSSSSHGSRHKSRQHRHRHRRSRSRGGHTARSGSTYNSSASTASSQLSDEGSTLGPHGGEGAPTHSAAYASVHPSVVESLYSLSSSVHGAHTRQARHIRRHRRHKHNQTIALSARNSIHRRSAPSLAASVQHSARLRRSSKVIQRSLACCSRVGYVGWLQCS